MKKTSFLLKFISFGILIFIWDYIFISFNLLSQDVPIHFDLQGNANSFVPKIMIWIIPIIATLLYVFAFSLSKKINSTVLNIPLKIKDNPEKSGLVVDVLNVVLMILIGIISYEIISVAIGKMQGFGSFINYFLGFIFLGVIAILVHSFVFSKKSIN